MQQLTNENTFAVVSDLRAFSEENKLLTSGGHSFTTICIHTSTERYEALEKACYILFGIDEKCLLQSVGTAVEMNRNGDYIILVPGYFDENVSLKSSKNHSKHHENRQ